MGTCGHDTSCRFGERLLVHVEEHSANGWKDGDLNASCGSGLLVFVARKSVTVDAKRFRYSEVLSQPEVYELPDGFIRSANG